MGIEPTCRGFSPAHRIWSPGAPPVSFPLPNITEYCDPILFMQCVLSIAWWVSVRETSNSDWIRSRKSPFNKGGFNISPLWKGGLGGILKLKAFHIKIIILDATLTQPWSKRQGNVKFELRIFRKFNKQINSIHTTCYLFKWLSPGIGVHSFRVAFPRLPLS